MQNLRKQLCWMLALLMALVLLVGNPLTGRANGVAFVPNQVVVKLNLATGATIDAINATYGTTTIKLLPNDPSIYQLQTPVGVDPAALAAQMALDQRLLFAEPNLIGAVLEGIGIGKWAHAGADPAPSGTQYAVSMLGLPQAHALSTGANTVVAVLDTGIQLNHPAFGGKLAPGYDFIDNDNTPDEDFAHLDLTGVDLLAGHGTHVAEIVHQVAPDANIMPVRVLDAHGLTDAFIVAQGIQYAVQHGATVINLSLGTTDKSALLDDVIQSAVEHTNVVVVASAGNANSSIKQWPAASSYALAVTAIGADKQKASFANYGSWVDMAAPGDTIFSAFPIDAYAWWSGTSMAAPFVAGQAALIQSRFPTLNGRQVTDRIEKTAQSLGPNLGAGLPNLVASLR
ncbi:MAG: S8 family serine peptidase [Caldilineaceae bacterium]